MNGTPLDDRHANVAREARKAGYDPALFGYQPVEKGAIDRVSPHGETHRSEGGFAIVRDADDDLSNQNVSSGRNKHENTAISARHRSAKQTLIDRKNCIRARNQIGEAR